MSRSGRAQIRLCANRSRLLSCTTVITTGLCASPVQHAPECLPHMSHHRAYPRARRLAGLSHHSSPCKLARVSVEDPQVTKKHPAPAPLLLLLAAIVLERRASPIGKVHHTAVLLDPIRSVHPHRGPQPAEQLPVVLLGNNSALLSSFGRLTCRARRGCSPWLRYRALASCLHVLAHLCRCLCSRPPRQPPEHRDSLSQRRMGKPDPAHRLPQTGCRCVQRDTGACMPQSIRSEHRLQLPAVGARRCCCRGR